jgi:hypothetical protein
VGHRLNRTHADVCLFDKISNTSAKEYHGGEGEETLTKQKVKHNYK